jgi:LuxR family maltose regulon positive regulatory protein
VYPGWAGWQNRVRRKLLELWTRGEPEAWPPWIVLQVGGSLALSLVELGRGPEFDRLLREIAPVADVVQQEWDDLEAGVLAPVRIAEGRRRYQNGDATTAAGLLRRAVAIAELHPRPTILALGLVYLAEAELGAGDRAAARDSLARAREVAEEEPLAAYAMARLVEAESRMGRGPARAAARSGALMEELTDRELSILRALQGSASQREIGAALFLSINTVKAYTKSLYRKLEVASRQNAVAAGRQLGLI